MRKQPLNLDGLHKWDIVSVDVETTGLHWYRDRMFGVAVAACNPKAKVMASGYWDIRDQPRVLDALREELPKCRLVVNHNVKFDWNFLIKEGIYLPQDRVECTSVRAALINEHESSFSLDALCKKYINKGKVDIWPELAKLFGGLPTKNVQIKNLHRAPAALAGKYAIADPELAILLWLWQEEEIARQGIQQIWGLERQLTPVLVQIEQQGVRVDEERAANALLDVKFKVDRAQTDLNKLAGCEVNVNSAPQMRKLFGTKKNEKGEWTTASGFKLENTEGGEAAMGKASLKVMEELGDARAKHVLTIRKMLKAGTFLKDHIIGHAVKGRVYPNYNQTRGENELGTGTGRFSIDDPALQQIPARDKDVAAIVRSCFIPEKGHSWGCADWEQFEFRWFAHYTNDASILKVYQDNPDADYHQLVSDITGISRNARFAGDPNAKQINLGLVFGMGRGEMAYQMGLDYTTRKDGDGREWKTAGDKANAVFNTYHDAIPGVKKLLDQASSIARSRGFVQTILGRRIRFPDGRFTHKAAGLVFQGTSADCMKLKMVELAPTCIKEGWPMLLSVHDELDFSTPVKEVKKAKPVIKKILETFDGESCPIKCRVPIRSNVEFNANWWESSK